MNPSHTDDQALLAETMVAARLLATLDPAHPLIASVGTGDTVSTTTMKEKRAPPVSPGSMPIAPLTFKGAGMLASAIVGTAPHIDEGRHGLQAHLPRQA